uniref:Uncharacterized protein n=1 Tax=Odontella aurita TaxID=265563 RepID=A0A7S4JCI8_9STRA|mmetsp:Transcript_43747/g.133104  ORF Transcript_43747/g.133104 Transcript_43747/m.133104 type:complete len:112 (+) Transcript_43747:35-370(+)
MTCVEALLDVSAAIESVGPDVLTGSSLLVKLELGLELGLRNTADTLKKTMLIGREGFVFYPCSKCRGAKTFRFCMSTESPFSSCFSLHVCSAAFLELTSLSKFVLEEAKAF